MSHTPAELFERHHLVVYRYLLRMTARGDVAEDLTQEVFVRVVRGVDGYDERGQERAWLLSIARNLLIDFQRKQRREPLDAVEEMVDRDSDPDASLDIKRAIATLPETDREAFLLRVVVGLGHDEIAALVGATPASVRGRIYRARVALKSRL